ncbi:MAG TPA: hypothetical protein VHZ07_27125 [Bryobacteraceae bacterium]|jgi:hypothetical protein|nr:hypothetical protein [Bryobacteraceae bacterium]
MEVRITRRYGKPLTLVHLGYFFLAIYFTFFAETVALLRPGQLADEYAGCQRLTEASWVLVAAIVLICNRNSGSAATRFELSLIPLFSYMALFFAFVYIAVPFIAWNAATRLNTAELQQSLSVREGSQRQLRQLKARIDEAKSIAELGAIPGLLQIVPPDERTNLAVAKQAAERVLNQRAANLDQQNMGEAAARAGFRRIQVARLIAHCAITVFFCIWIWGRTRSVRYDFEIE